MPLHFLPLGLDLREVHLGAEGRQTHLGQAATREDQRVRGAMCELEALPEDMLCVEDSLIKAEEEEEDLSSGRDSDDEEPDASTSPRVAKRRKKNRLDLSDVPMNLPPIPSDRAGSASRFKGVCKNGKKWKAQIQIPTRQDSGT